MDEHLFQQIFTEGLVCLKYDCRWELVLLCTGTSLDLGNIKSGRDIKRKINRNTHLKSDDIKFNNLIFVWHFIVWKSFMYIWSLKHLVEVDVVNLFYSVNDKTGTKKLSTLFKVTYVAVRSIAKRGNLCVLP